MRDHVEPGDRYARAGASLALPMNDDQPAMTPPDRRVAPDLVEVARLDSTIAIDVRYATSNNFLGRPLYPCARLFLLRPVAMAVIRVHRALAASGHGLLLFDGYRPWTVTRTMWEAADEGQRRYLADPARGSRHNRGAAIDLSLADPVTGEERAMPSAFDEFTARAHLDYAGGDPAALARRDLLVRHMEAEGFTTIRHEWWHFDHRGGEAFPILDVPLDRLP